MRRGSHIARWQGCPSAHFLPKAPGSELVRGDRLLHWYAQAGETQGRGARAMPGRARQRRGLKRRAMQWCRRWYRGWSDLLGHDNVPVYRDLPRWQRLLLDATVLRSAVATRGFWRGTFAAVALTGAAQIAAWRFDLAGGRGDLLLCLPTLALLPGVAAGRRRLLAAVLRRRRVRPAPSGNAGAG